MNCATRVDLRQAYPAVMDDNAEIMARLAISRLYIVTYSQRKRVSGEGFMLVFKSLKLVLASGTAFAALNSAMAGTAAAQSTQERDATQPGQCANATARPGHSKAMPARAVAFKYNQTVRD